MDVHSSTKKKLHSDWLFVSLLLLFIGVLCDFSRCCMVAVHNPGKIHDFQSRLVPQRSPCGSSNEMVEHWLRALATSQYKKVKKKRKRSMSQILVTPSVGGSSQHTNNILMTALSSITLASALNVPPHNRSSHTSDCGYLSATRAHPMSNQSFRHEFGAPDDPLPTIDTTRPPFESPDNVKEFDRVESASNPMS